MLFYIVLCGVRNTKNALNASHNKYYDDGVHLTFNGLIKCLEVKFFRQSRMRISLLSSSWHPLFILKDHFGCTWKNVTSRNRLDEKIVLRPFKLSAASFFNVPATLKFMKNANLIHSSPHLQIFSFYFQLKYFNPCNCVCLNC